MNVWFFSTGAIRAAATRRTCPLRRAVNPSMGAHHKLPVCEGLRGQVPHITAMGVGLIQQESAELSGDTGGTPRDLTRQDVADESPGKGSRRVSGGIPRVAADRIAPVLSIH